MSKNKHSEENQAYLLFKNKQFKIIDINKIQDYLAKYDISHVLIPIKKYNSINYMMINPEFLYHKIGSIELDGTLAIQGFCYGIDSDQDGNGMYEIVEKVHLSADTLDTVCSLLESLMVLNFSNTIVNPDYSDEYYLFALDNVSITAINDREKLINSRDNKTCMDKNHSSDDYGSISRVIDRVNTMINYITIGKAIKSKDVEFMECERVYICINNSTWKYTNSPQLAQSAEVVGLFQPEMGTYTFLDHNTYSLLHTFLNASSYFQVYLYVCHGNSEIEIDDNFVMSSKYFDDYPDTFEPIWDYRYELYSIFSLVELLSNFKHVASAIEIFTQTIFGKVVDDTLFNIALYVDTTNMPNVRIKQKRLEYIYEVTYSDLFEKGDILYDIIETFFDKYGN